MPYPFLTIFQVKTSITSAMENDAEIKNLSLCMACLCVGRTLQNLTDTKLMKYFLDILSEIQLSNVSETSPDICWECEAILRRAVSFREQVQDSYRILQTYTSDNLQECLLTDVSRPLRLKTQSFQIIDIAPSIVIEVPCLAQEANEMKLEVQSVFVKDESNDWVGGKDVKQEGNLPDAYTDYSDYDADMSLLKIKAPTRVKKEHRSSKKLNSKIRRGKKIVKSLKKERKQQPKRTKTTQQKIQTIELTYEEMLNERELESKRDSFVNATHKCATCLIAFSYDKSYAEHMASKHAPELGDYSCPICRTVVASVDSFTAHYKRHLRRYSCGACGKRTMDRKVMQQHYDTTHEATTREYKCNMCGVVSRSLDSHRYHRDTHKARAQCTQCDKTFSHRAGLMNHRLAVHKLNNVFPCPVCGKVFRWKTSLKKHQDSHDRKDTQPDAAHCSPCGVSFGSVCSYQRHMRNSLKHVTHDQLKFTCDHCARRYANKTKLRDHIEEKHLHRTYQCDICLKPSKNRVCLDQHIRNVHRGRPNNKMCHHCGKGFPTKVQLESHIRSHTGERPYICELCPTTFSQQSNLYKHNRQIHLNIKSKRYTKEAKKSKDESQTCVPAVTSAHLTHPTTGDKAPPTLVYYPPKGFTL